MTNTRSDMVVPFVFDRLLKSAHPARFEQWERYGILSPMSTSVNTGQNWAYPFAGIRRMGTRQSKRRKADTAVIQLSDTTNTTNAESAT